jgi:guanylate kinase
MDTTDTVVTITGPSCTGKDTLVRHLMTRGFERLMSCTTRPPRTNEYHGVDYWFVNEDFYRDECVAGNVVESSFYDGHWYFTTSQDIGRALSHTGLAVKIVEPEGAASLEAQLPQLGIEVLTVYVDNPLPVLIARLFDRFKGDHAGIAERYASRVLQLTKNHADWPRRGNWHLYFSHLDNAREGASVDEVGKVIEQYVA